MKSYKLPNKKKRKVRCNECGGVIEGIPAFIETKKVCRRCYYVKHTEFKRKHKEGKIK